MVLEETKRTYMYLNLYGYHVDRVFINRVLPPQTGNSFMEEWRRIQSRYIEETESVFRHIPVTRIPWYPKEIKGIQAVELLSKELPDNEVLFASPASLQSEDSSCGGAETYEVTENGYRLRLSIPGADHVSATLCDRDLDIRVGTVLRKIPLPNVLYGAQIVSTALQDGMFLVDFSAPAAHKALR
jgi:arsenite-transporting ATPase